MTIDEAIKHAREVASENKIKVSEITKILIVLLKLNPEKLIAV